MLGNDRGSSRAGHDGGSGSNCDGSSSNCGSSSSGSSGSSSGGGGSSSTGNINLLPVDAFPYVKDGAYYTGGSSGDASIECISLESILKPCHIAEDHDNPNHYYVNKWLYMFDNTQAVLF